MTTADYERSVLLGECLGAIEDITDTLTRRSVTADLDTMADWLVRLKSLDVEMFDASQQAGR